MNRSLVLLGGLTPRIFLRRHWQKRPLLVRGALPGFAGVVSKRTLFQLAQRDDVESRIVERRRDPRHGPFSVVSLKKTQSTLLVSGVNLHVPAADALLQRFAFVPQARLDDVMVSYATPGGGVGPHVDSYDVFLLQGPGRRRWRVWSAGGKVLTYVVRPGDLLYLPPGLKHDGVALDECTTYSIGFRAPRGAELGAAFLDWLHERGLPDARYADPGLAPARAPGRVPAEMVAFTRKLLKRIRWSGGDVTNFLGAYLSEAKPHVVFRPRRGRRPLARSVVRLDPRTRLLYAGGAFFINGERVALKGRAAAALRELADRRSLAGARLARFALNRLLSTWRDSGYVHFEER